jgi:hypothetical protein
VPAGGGGGDVEPPPEHVDGLVTARATSAQLAAQLRTSRATFQSVHASGVRDNAHAAQNIIDTADGRAATRSSYDADGARGLPKAPGGVVELRPSMLKGLLAIATTTSVRVSELAGGQHNANSVHYAGIAFDIDQINGAVPTTKNAEPLLSSCRASGASLAQVERPGLSGAHLHCEWRS